MTEANAHPARRSRGGRIPLWVKVVYTVYVGAFLGVMSSSSPLNFLWFCNAALLVTLAAVWLESSLLVSMQLLSILWPHVFWQIDYFTQLLTDIKVFDACGLTPARYMFDPSIPALKRCLSLQHAWMLYLLLWLVWRLGYDRRALAAQTVFCWGLLLLTYACVTDIYGPAGNVNNVLGVSANRAPSWMAPWTWLVVLMGLLPILWYGPLHFLFRRVFGPAKGPLVGERWMAVTPGRRPKATTS